MYVCMYVLTLGYMPLTSFPFQRASAMGRQRCSWQHYVTAAQMVWYGTVCSQFVHLQGSIKQTVDKRTVENEDNNLQNCQ